jgi:hypothetical protein
MNAEQSIISEPTRIVKRDRAPEPMQVTETPASNIGSLMAIIDRAATDPNFTPERMMQLLEVKERWEATEARKAYVAAMAAFKENPPIFHKVKHVDYGPGKAKFDYAPIAEVVSKVLPALAAHGLTHNWLTSFADGKITVRCTLTHRLGHSESIDSPPMMPGSNPALSPSQNYQATITFWQRMTLQSITGTAAGDMPDTDDGGAGGGDERPALAEDVKTALKDAAKEGSDALARTFKGLSETTRARIVADYHEEWTALKADAAKVRVQP